jgi:hypothetical protein
MPCCVYRSIKVSKTINYMNRGFREEKKIHISNLDEFLAASFVDSKEKPLKIAIRKEGTQGYISVLLLTAGEGMEEDGIDFELSSCECVDFDNMQISHFLKKPVFTSSAYEFFDFMFMSFSSLECLVDFTGNTWKVGVLKTDKAI